VLAVDLAANRLRRRATDHGRADQIRVHLAACGAPIVGDPLYGPGGVPCSDATPGEGGYFLHATALRVRHPSTGGWLVARSRPAWL
jgi:23S rRNA pseudouridine1911/1915/1917 synthase